MSTVELLNVSKRFGVVQAVADVSLAVEPGEVRALVGENGSGKSTVLGMLAGVLAQDSGEIRVDGRALKPGRPEGRGQVGVVYQDSRLCGNLSVAENLLLGRLPSARGRFDRRATVDAAQAVIDRHGLGLDPRAQVGELSHDQQTMVETGVALARACTVLAFDETTASLTHDEIQRLFAIIGDRKRAGAAIILVTHRLREIFDVCDTVTVLRDGATRGTLDVAATDEDEIVRLMVGRELERATRRAGGVGERRLRARQVRPRFAPHAFDLDVHAGEIVGLAGLVGSGRTTLLKSLFGLVGRTGELSVQERDVVPGRPRAAIDAGMGYVPERRREDGLSVNQSVAANAGVLLTGSRPLFSLASRRAEEALVGELVEGFRLKTSSSAAPVRTLSGGNQQKIVLGRWLLRRPAVLLLDEPTRGIDVATQHEIHRLIEDVVNLGTAVVMASSELPALLELCDRILVLREGEVVGEFRRGVGEEELAAAMTGAQVHSPLEE